MATVTGLTAERMLEIEAACIVGGAVPLDHLILTRQDGSTIDAGSVRGPQGIQGIQGIQGAKGSAFYGVTANVATLGDIPGALIGDFIVNTSANPINILNANNVTAGGVVKVVTATTVSAAGNIRGAQGIQGIQGIQGDPGSVGTGPAGGDLGGNYPNPIFEPRNEVWILTEDGKNRFYFSLNGLTYFASPNGYEWRNGANTAALMSLLNNGELTVNGTRIYLNGAAAAIYEMQHTAAGADLKRSRIRNESGKTYLQNPDDAYAAILKTGWVFDHATGAMEFPNTPVVKLVDLFHFAQLLAADIAGNTALSALHTTTVSKAGKYELSLSYVMNNSSVYNYATCYGLFGGTATRLDGMGNAQDWGEPANDGSMAGTWVRYFSTPDDTAKTITSQIQFRVNTGGSGNVNQFPMNASVAVKYLGP